MARSINLFEYVKYSWRSSEELDGLPEDFSDLLEHTLQLIWKDRNRFVPTNNFYGESESKTQRFVEFKKNHIVPGKWLGSIHFKREGKDYNLNLLPKIFHREERQPTESETKAIFAHILWWLAGSEKQFNTSLTSSMQGMQSDFLEAMIYVFSCFTIEVFSTSTYNYYETVCEETQAIKGAIDFGAYAKNFGQGRLHSVPCIYDSFQFDNGFNRIVKHVCTLLANATNNPASRKNLDEILFIMDEVEDREVTIEDCDKVNLNPIHTEFKTILDHCRMFLSSLSTYKWKNEYEVFAFLIPAETLFENFIYSTLRKDRNPRVRKVSRSRGNKGRTHLVRQLPNPTYNRYKMINDMVVRTVDDRFLIFDTKYKKIYGRNRSEDEDVIDNVYNVSQADVYQMVSYAIGSGIDRIGLIYPSLLEDDPEEELPVYEIRDEFNPETVIRIHPIKVDITHELKLALEPKGRLEKVFEKSMNKLKSQLSVAIDHCLSEP